MDDRSKLFSGLCEAYGYKPTARRVAIYARALSDLSYEELRDALTRVVRESKYFPSVAEIRSHVEPATDDAALVAWSAAQRASETAGAYRTVTFEDGAAAEALVAVFGSWSQFCEQNDIALATKQKEFIAAYRQARRRGETSERRLPGICEASGQYSDRTSACLVARSGKVLNAADGEIPKLLPQRSISFGALEK